MNTHELRGVCQEGGLTQQEVEMALDYIQNSALTSFWNKTQLNKSLTYALITTCCIHLFLIHDTLIQSDKQNDWEDY